MKKILFLLVALFVANSVAFSQEKEELVTESNVERLVDKYSTKIEASIISLAESLQQPAEYVYTVLVRQQYVKASASTAMLLVFIIFFIVFKVSISEADFSERGFNRHALISIISGAVGLIGIIVFTADGCFMDILQGFINPDYGAIQDIANLFK